MTKREKKAGAFLLIMALLLTACARTEETPTKRSIEAQEEMADERNIEAQEEQQAQEDAAVRTTVFAPTDYVSDEEMQLADCWQASKEDALAKVIQKASQKEAVTIAVIGGSITQGTISNGSSDASVTEKKCYADIFFSWWTESFPETEFTFINAGIGATDSYLGVHRVTADVLDKKPDLVLVEFAVNDSNTFFYKKTYDNLVRMIAKNENEPAILLLFMAQTNGASAQENQSIIGFQYALPMVSYGNVMKEMLSSGKYDEKELSGDTVHPSALGHAITGEILWKYLNGIYENPDLYGEPEKFVKDAVTKECYTNAAVLDALTLTPDSMEGFSEKTLMDAFPNGWLCEEANGEITFTLSFSNLGILYYQQIDGNGAQYEVYVDGEVAAVLNADFTGGWGNCAKAQECFVSDTAKEHEVTLRRKEDSTGDAFGLLGFLVSSP